MNGGLEREIAFLIWALCGMIFVVTGIIDFFFCKKKPVGFWANAEQFQVEEQKIRPYNKAVGKLFFVFGSVFILLGLPLLQGQNSPGILLSVIGTMIEVIAIMVVYVTVIEKKYRKK